MLSFASNQVLAVGEAMIEIAVVGEDIRRNCKIRW